jgi:hypothetical protein
MPIETEVKHIETQVKEPVIATPVITTTTSVSSSSSSSAKSKRKYIHSNISVLRGTSLYRISDGETIDLGELPSNSLLILGTYAADFNAVEYMQRLRYYIPALKSKGIENLFMVVNAEPEAVKALASLVQLPGEVQLVSDPLGTAGKAYGVEKGWRPDDAELNPYLKLFGMLFGLGAWATLPSVIGGYIGNPFVPQPWIEDALLVGQLAGRWPNTALVVDGSGGVVENKFKSLKYVGGWGRRPLELATLRLQNMVGVSLKNWSALKPSESSLNAGVLTQLGACLVIGDCGEIKYEFIDQGICHVCNFESMLEKI